MSFEEYIKSRVGIEQEFLRAIGEARRYFAKLAEDMDFAKRFWQSVVSLYMILPKKLRQEVPNPDVVLEKYLDLDVEARNPIDQKRIEESRYLEAEIHAGKELLEKIIDVLDRNGMLLYTSRTLVTRV